MNTNELYSIWKDRVKADELKNDLENISEEEIFDRFYRELDFGTAGLRGVLGAGTNRMNIYTVARASTGVAKYVSGIKRSASIAIAYDSRNNSELFAKTAAAVYASFGIKVYVYPYLMPTPALSYAVRTLGTDAGVVVTASHNPAKYNGYKVYGNDGCQIGSEVANSILEKIAETPYFEEIPSFDKLLDDGVIEYISDDIINGFVDGAISAGKSLRNIERNLKLVYTPLNGAGLMSVTKALDKCGYKNIIIVPEQKDPDGNFPTCPYPNPEFKEALALGLELLKKEKADLLLATDPDSDRVGTAVLDGEGYRLISGNEMGILLLDYICRQRLANGNMPKDPMAVKTIVSSAMTDEVAKKYGVRIVDVLTGFKYIGEQIALLEEKDSRDSYVFGFEESYGYLCSPYVRDKDAVSASVIICEMANFYKSEGKTLGDRMDELYREFGSYKNVTDNFAFEGSAGMEKMASIMESLRNEPPVELFGRKLLKVSDYKKSESYDMDGNVEKLDLPKSNVLKFIFENGLTVIARPSGTEPKLKIYYTIKADTEREAEEMVSTLTGKDGIFASKFIK